MNITTVQINGKPAIVFVPELVQELAVVDLKVLQRLAALLPAANLSVIKRDLITRLNESAANMEQYVAILRDELAFHESVNLIELYKPVNENELVAEPRKPWEEHR